MANAIIRHAVKDAAWFTANASLVLQLGRVVFKSNTLTFVRGDGVTALSSLPIYNCLPIASTDTLEDVRLRGNTINGTINGAAAILNLNDTVPGVPSFSINTAASNLYIHDSQFFAGDTNQNVGLYANIAAEDLGMYNSSGSLTLNADGTISAGSNKVISVANGTNANDAVNKAQLDGKITAGAVTNHSPSHTGFSVNPTINAGDCYSYLVGKMCYFNYYPSAAGTSNANAYTITLPYVAHNASIQYSPCMVQDNVNVSLNMGRAEIAANTNILTISRNNQNLAWATSGSKRAFISLVYIIA